ncbi:MAG: carbohydrate binding family 9 domain-containing protein, partial [Acidobacteria bacterium]|nr:carbohydrate binding family 9 domain-containing protein [Acidobacteriota bacterium]
MATALPAQNRRSGETTLPAATAIRTTEPPLLDGVLSEEIWSQAPLVTGFLQKDPQEGAPASEKTEVRILFDTRNIYFGVLCYDTDPGGIRATELRRDNGFGNDDIFEVILDTFHDHRSGYLFRINPLGTKYDATVADDGQRTNRDWDEKWEVKAQIHEQGWSAEIAIPFKSLRFLNSERLVWGVNFHRDIKRKNEDVFWTAHSRDFSFNEVSRAGNLEGLAEIQGFTFRLKPFVTTGGSQVVRRGQKESDHLTDIGIEDAKYMITPQLALDLTVNPDFAQADVDEAQVNLTRFSQFFPEKREFFQERAGIFQFGTGEPFGRPQVLLFHSRRIGLSEGREEIPIRAGLKFSGTQGPLDLGLLNMQTGRSGETPGQNFTVARVKGNILARSYVGAIFTRNTAGPAESANQAAGVDASFIFFRNLNLRGFLAKNDSAHLKDGQWAGHGLIDWESDRIEFSVEHLNVQENFNPEIGFVGREDSKRTVAEFDYQPRPNIDLIRQMEFGTAVEYLTNQKGALETRVYELEWGAEFESGDDVNLTFLRTFERLVDPFRIRGGLGTVPAGDYEFNEYQFRYRA